VIGGMVGLVVGVCLLCIFWPIYYRRKAILNAEIRTKSGQN
jgi:preprotein translocase subunit SecD